MIRTDHDLFVNDSDKYCFACFNCGKENSVCPKEAETLPTDYAGIKKIEIKCIYCFAINIFEFDGF